MVAPSMSSWSENGIHRTDSSVPRSRGMPPDKNLSGGLPPESPPAGRGSLRTGVKLKLGYAP
jgi:hypothetical protein